MLEAEGMLSSVVKPGTFLIRRGADSKEYILTVKAPEGGPQFRHLPVTLAKDGRIVAQFGAMETSMNFESINELVRHFQITPIPFEEDSPDIVLTNPWNKSEVWCVITVCNLQSKITVVYWSLLGMNGLKDRMLNPFTSKTWVAILLSEYHTFCY